MVVSREFISDAPEYTAPKPMLTIDIHVSLTYLYRPWPSEKWLYSKPLQVFIALLLFLPAAVSATPVKSVDLYSASMEVSSRSASERQRLMATALREVLTKCTGDSQVVEHYAGLRDALASAKRYLHSYQYQLREIPVVPQVFDRETDETEREQRQMSKVNTKEQLWLQLSFDERAVRNVIRQANAPVWHARRPLVAVELDDRSRYNSEQERLANNALIRYLLANAATRRGLPVSLTLRQVADELDDLPEDNDLPVSMQVPTVEWYLRGQLAKTSDEYLFLWRVQQEQQLSLSESLGIDQRGTLKGLIDEGVNRIADQMAEQFALTGGQSGVGLSQTMVIYDVTTSKDYLALVSLLREQSIFASATLREVDGSTLLYSLPQSAQNAKLRSLLTLTDQLFADTSTDELVFYWRSTDD